MNPSGNPNVAQNSGSRRITWESSIAVLSGVAAILSFVLQYPALGIIFLVISFAIIWMLAFPSFARVNSRIAAAFSLIVCIITFIAGFQLASADILGSSIFSSISTAFMPAADCSTASADSHGIGLPINFVNASSRTIEVFWINDKGRAISYGDVRQNDSMGISTFLNHSWCVRDKTTGAAIRAVIANDQNRLIIIR